MDVLAVEAPPEKAVEHIRAGKGPYFLEAVTYRFRPHSMFDAELYRTKAEVEECEEARSNHPVHQLPERAQAASTDADVASDREGCRRRSSSTRWISPKPAPGKPVEDLTRFVYSERSAAMNAGRTDNRQR